VELIGYLFTRLTSPESNENFSRVIVRGKMEERNKGMVCIFISLIAAATITIISKIALLNGGNPTKILLLRFLIVTVFLVVYMKIKNISWVVSHKSCCALLGLGFAYANVALLFFLAMKYISPSLGSLILYTYPIIVTMTSALFLKEKITISKTIALFFTMIGCVLVIGTDFSIIDYRGVILAFLTAIFFSLYIVGNKKMLENIPPVVSLAYMTAFCVVFFGVKAFIEGSLNFNYSTADIISALLLAIIPTLIGIMFLFKALKLLGASKTAIISSFEPVVTLMLAYFIIGDRITLIQLVGGGFILSSVYLVKSARETVSQNPIQPAKAVFK